MEGKGMEQVTQLYDVKSAALLLAVSPWTVRAYIRKGRLQPVRIGRLVRLEVEELRRFIAEAKSPSEVAPRIPEEKNDEQQ
jgi:excisionase family DNA binding protein